jgi:hypothetical protein
MALTNLATRQQHELDVEGTRSSIGRAIALLDDAGIVFIRPDVCHSGAQRSSGSNAEPTSCAQRSARIGSKRQRPVDARPDSRT